LHLHQVNPHIQHRPEAIAFPTGSCPWEPLDEVRIGGVSSFSFGGANAHMVVAEAPELSPATTRRPATDRPVHLLVLRARTEAALRALAGRYSAYLNQHPELSWADVCASASTGRAEMSWRLTCRAASARTAAQALMSWTRGESAPGVDWGLVRGRPPRIAFLFGDRGSRPSGVGIELLATRPVFRAAIERCESAMRPLRERTRLGALFSTGADHDRLDRSLVEQPALFALEYALAELWRSWGVVPDVVLGEGVGGYAAACVAGLYSLEEGIRRIVERARLEDDLPSHSPMPVLIDGLDGADDWGRHNRERIPFLAGVRSTRETEAEVFLEIGPESGLIAQGQRSVAESRVSWLSSLSPGRGASEQMLESLSALYLRGVPIDWDAFERPHARHRVELPTYPFQRRRFWIDLGHPPVESPRNEPGERAPRPSVLREPSTNLNGHCDRSPHDQPDQHPAQTNGDGRLERLIAYLTEELQTVLELASPPDIQSDLTDMGMDSLLAFELQDRLNANLRANPPLSSDDLFRFRNVEALAQHLMRVAVEPSPEKLRPTIGVVPDDLERFELEKQR
jgi:acyl transferase domain-containing protein